LSGDYHKRRGAAQALAARALAQKQAAMVTKVAKASTEMADQASDEFGIGGSL
jgi:hypothetical protein